LSARTSGLQELASIWARFEEAERQLFAACGIDVAVRVLELSRLRLHVRVLEYGRGPALLLVPGGGVPAAAFASLMVLLPGWRIIGLERPGWGPSEGFSYPRVGFRRFCSQFLAEALDALDVPTATVVGSSIGGTWALWLAATEPNRVCAVVCLGCPAFLLDSGIPTSLRAQAAADGPPPPPEVLSVSPFNPEFGTVLECATFTPGFLESRLDLVRCAIELLHSGQELDLSETALRKVTQPVRFCWGNRDPYASVALASKARSMMKRASVVAVAGGHHPWLESPESCAQSIKDLDASSVAGVIS
jgi:pimeloyl-ACP methyl ester carboxylesterase